MAATLCFETVSHPFLSAPTTPWTGATDSPQPAAVPALRRADVVVGMAHKRGAHDAVRGPRLIGEADRATPSRAGTNSGIEPAQFGAIAPNNEHPGSGVPE